MSEIINMNNKKSEWEFNPYDAPRSKMGQFGPQFTAPSGQKTAFSVTHDLTDDELKRFVNFDAFYDPMPLFGFIPQWVMLAVVTAGLGGVFGAMNTRGNQAWAAGFGALVGPLVALAALDFRARERRKQARAQGLCDGRTVTVTPEGLTLKIPGVRPTMSRTIGPDQRPWSAIRKITSNEVDLTFWMGRDATDPEGRWRLIVPLRAFASASDAAAFENAARFWHAAASGG